jgi:N-methylhydantoinase A
VIVPFATGVLSAWGMLHADVRHDLSAPISGLADDPEVLSRLDVLAEALRAEGSRLLDLERVPKEQREYILSADMRYVGQEHTLTVRLDDAVKLADNFHSAYRSRYGHAMQRAAVEFSNVRLAATGVTPSMDEGLRPTRADATAEHRDVWFAGSRHRAGIVSRDSLTADAVRGPAVIEEAGSTTLVPPSWEAIRDESNAIVLRKVNS